MTRREERERLKDGPEIRLESFGADAAKAAFAGWPISGKPDIGRWSAGRRSVPGRRALQTRHRWARAPRDGLRNPILTNRICRLSQSRQVRGAPGFPIARETHSRGLANPWRLPALHSPR